MELLNWGNVGAETGVVEAPLVEDSGFLDRKTTANITPIVNKSVTNPRDPYDCSGKDTFLLSEAFISSARGKS